MPERPPIDGLDAELLERYLAGECGEEETALVRRWLMAHPDAAARLDRYLAALDDEGARPSAPDTAASWQAIRARLDPADGAPARTRAAHAPPRRPRWRGAAAALAAACALAAAGLAYRARSVRPPAVAAQPQQTYATAVRERSTLRLPDGTHVRLAPGTRLRVATDFGVERRDVYLDGEAYFEVVHDDALPFTVFVGATSVRDIGTAFSVRGYASDGAVQVVVREGEVAVLGVGRLVAGDVARVPNSGVPDVRRGVAVDSLLAWTAGRLVYTDAPLGAVLDDVRRWYGADVRLADSSIAGLLFTGALTDVTAAEAVEQVAATLGLDARRVGDHVMLAPNPRKTPQSR